MEKQTLLNASWTETSVLLTPLTVCQFVYCTLSSVYLLTMGTTALHLSLLSGNFYTLVVGMLLFEQKVLYSPLKNTFFILYSIKIFDITTNERTFIYITGDCRNFGCSKFNAIAVILKLFTIPAKFFVYKIEQPTSQYTASICKDYFICTIDNLLVHSYDGFLFHV